MGRLDAVAGGARVSPDEGSRCQLVRAMVASTVGTSLEWYDFFLYGTVAA